MGKEPSVEILAVLSQKKPGIESKPEHSNAADFYRATRAFADEAEQEAALEQSEFNMMTPII